MKHYYYYYYYYCYYYYYYYCYYYYYYCYYYSYQTFLALTPAGALLLLLAGPALFRGRLRAFGKCTNGVAFSKGTPNLASVRLTL